MATATEYAGAAAGTSWTDPTNANADDAAYATYTIAAKNTTGNENTLSNFGFDASIPADATISQVDLIVEHKVSTGSGIAHLESAVAISGTVGTFNTDSAEPTTDTQRSYTAQARPGGGSWTRTDLLDGTFTVRLRARSGNNATSVVYSWDYARVVVTYTSTILVSLPATAIGTGLLSRQVNRTLADAAVGAAVLVRRVARSLTDSAVGSATLAKRVGRTFADSAVGSATLARRIAKTLADAAVGVATLVTDLTEYAGEGTGYLRRHCIDKVTRVVRRRIR